MPGVYRLEFLPLWHIREVYEPAGVYYELGDGSFVAVPIGLIWCRACRRFTCGERLEAIEDIDRQIAESREQPRHETLGSDEFRIRWTRKLENKRRWREARQSLPRCLECGSTQNVAIAVGRWTRHPSGLGWVRVSMPALYTGEIRFRFFSTEGDPIAKSREEIHKFVQEHYYPPDLRQPTEGQVGGLELDPWSTPGA
jgi:hypothetical protein